MGNNELIHYGVPGMRWGVRRTPSQLGHKTRPKKKTGFLDKMSKKKAKKKVSSKPKKSVKEMTDSELSSKIARLEMEKKYRDLLRGENQRQVSSGKKFVNSVLENSAKNIATQAATYMMGAAVNQIYKKMFDTDINMVNPKKGQKDK